MRIKLIKLIENELIKIFKRKSIYVLLIISLIAIIVYNYMKETWRIDLNKLRTLVLRRQNDVLSLDLTVPATTNSTHSNAE